MDVKINARNISTSLKLLYNSITEVRFPKSSRAILPGAVLAGKILGAILEAKEMGSGSRH